MTSVTTFKNVFDNKTDSVFMYPSFSHFEEVLYKLSKLKGEKGGKNSSNLISPALYKENTTRANKNVSCWAGWAALDVDSFTIKTTLKEDLNKIFGDIYYICYSTASSTEAKPKFRIVLPFEGIVESDKLPHFWFALQQEFNSLGDEQTKDISDCEFPS